MAGYGGVTNVGVLGGDVVLALAVADYVDCFCS